MRQIKQIAFGEFAPDSTDVDSQQLDLAIGMVPIYGEYRSVSKLRELSSSGSKNPINGSLVHLITPERSNQTAIPTGDLKDNTATQWLPFGDGDLAPEDADPADYWWRVTAPVSEGTGISMRTEGAVPPLNNNVQFELSDQLEDPNIDTGHILRMRYRVWHAEAMDTYAVYCALYEGASQRASVGVFEGSHSGDGWQTLEYELADVEVQGIGDYTSLHLQITGTCDFTDPVDPLPVPLVAVVNEAPAAWQIEVDVGDDAEDTTKIEVLQDDDQATLLYQSGLGVKIFETLLYDVPEPVVPASPGDNWELYAWGNSPDVGMDITLRLMQVDEEIAVVTGSVSQGEVPEKVSGVLLEADVAEITDYTKLSIIVQAATTGASQITLRPNANKQVINYVAKPSGQIHEVVSDQDDDTWAEATADAQFGCQLPTPAETPPGGTSVTVKAKVETDGGRCKFRLRFGDGISGDLFTWTGGYVQNEVVTLSSGNNSPASVDWPTAYLEVLNIDTAVGTQVKVLEAWVETEGPSEEFKAEITEVGLLSPTETPGIEVCFAEFDLPISKPETPGDTAQVYAGNEVSLFEVSDVGGFQDVSKDADQSYGTSPAPQNSAPTSWEFCSWGNRVVAVNGSDPCQWQDDPGERFVDLMDVAVEPETEIFTARFCAVARDFLFLGNCLHPTDPAVGEYTVWWSDINNPRLFRFVDPAHLSDYQPLVTTSGSITGLSGGEHIHIAKRTSMYRGTFVGPPLIWDIQVASYEEGTMYGSSLVTIDRDLFFFGSGGFRHLPYGSGVRPIGDGKISKMFTDKIYEDRALAQFSTTDIRLIQNALVGAYDQWSRIIYWLYRGIADNAYQNRMMIVYNPWTDQWSCLDLPLSNTAGRPEEVVINAGYSHLNALPTLPTDENPVTRGVICFGYTGADITYERMIDDEHYDVHLRTKIISSSALSGAQKVVKVHGIRFITSIGEALGELNFSQPIISATIAGSKDVHFTCDLIKETVVTGTDNQDDNGWLMLDEPVPGEYFVIEAEYKEIWQEMIEDLIGYELDIEVGASK